MSIVALVVQGHVTMLEALALTGYYPPACVAHLPLDLLAREWEVLARA